MTRNPDDGDEGNRGDDGDETGRRDEHGEGASGDERDEADVRDEDGGGLDGGDSPAGRWGGRPASGPDYPVPDDPEWEILDSVVEYETPWYTGGYDLVGQPDGSEKRYYWAELAPAVVIVAAADDRVLVVEQYRPAIRERHLELPAGIVERGESYTTAAARELREETGYDAAGLSILAEFWVATGVLRHERAVVYAEGLEPVERDLDENEFLTVRTVSVDEAMAVARQRPTHDATIEGLLLAQDEGLI